MYLHPSLSCCFGFQVNCFCLKLLHLKIYTWNNIRACWALGKPILAFKVDSKIFDQVLRLLLDAKSCDNTVKLVFNLDDDYPI
jgi:hypothetical protein